MTRWLAYIFLFVMLFALGLRPSVILHWKINQDFITEKYCVNKDQPMLNCNGKCYLSQQLEQLELKEKEEREQYPSPQQKVENTSIIFFVTEFKRIDLTDNLLTHQNYSFYINFYEFLTTQSPWVPPTF